MAPYIRPVNGASERSGSRGTLYGQPTSRYDGRHVRRRESALAYAATAAATHRGRRVLIVAGVVPLLVVGATSVAWWYNGSPGTRYVAAESSGRKASPHPVQASGTAGASRAATRPGDPGVAMCVEIRDTKVEPSAPGSNNDAQYRYVRKQFASSRYADIRRAGTRFLDAILLMPEPTGTDLTAILQQIAAKLMTSYGVLSAACAHHGVKLPSMTAG